jgi:hypothetical protein
MPPWASQEDRTREEGTAKVDGGASRSARAAHNYLRQKRQIMTGEPYGSSALKGARADWEQVPDDSILTYRGSSKTGEPDCLPELRYSIACDGIAADAVEVVLRRALHEVSFGRVACTVSQRDEVVILDFIYGDSSYVTGRSMVQMSVSPRKGGQNLHC